MSIQRLKAKSEANGEAQRIRARRERIIETARRIFESISYEERGAGLAATLAASQAQTAIRCAESFEDAADKYRNGVAP